MICLRASSPRASTTLGTAKKGVYSQLAFWSAGSLLSSDFLRRGVSLIKDFPIYHLVCFLVRKCLWVELTSMVVNAGECPERALTASYCSCHPRGQRWVFLFPLHTLTMPWVCHCYAQILLLRKRKQSMPSWPDQVAEQRNLSSTGTQSILLCLLPSCITAGCTVTKTPAVCMMYVNIHYHLAIKAAGLSSA